MRDGVASDTPVNQIPQFTSANYAKLSENEYYRYIPNSDVIGHLVVGPDGRAMQFAMPDQTTGLAAPLVENLSRLTAFNLQNNKKTMLGYAEQTPYISRRAYAFSVAYEQEDPVSYTYYPMSPKKNPVTYEDRPFDYDAGSVERFQDSDAVRAEVASFQKREKTGEALHIKNEDIPIRMAQRRAPDQNTVMGRHFVAQAKQGIRRQRGDNMEITTGRITRSAVEEMRDFLGHYRDILSQDMIQILEKSVNAPLKGVESQSRGEWLHRDGHNLHSLDLDPQRADNLGAAEKRYNTEMMIGERAVQFFSLNVPNSRNSIKCDFKMLLDSEVIDMIHFVSCIQVAGFTFKIKQDIDVFQREPQCVRASDLATLVGIFFAMLHKQAPRSVSQITQGQLNSPVIRFSGNFFHAHTAAASVEREMDSEERLLLS